MAKNDTGKKKEGKIEKPLTGIQAVAQILEVRADNVSRIIRGHSLCRPERVEFYKNELHLVGRAIEEHVERRKQELTNQKENV